MTGVIEEAAKVSDEFYARNRQEGGGWAFAPYDVRPPAFGRVAAVPLQAEQVLGLLKSVLRPEPPLPADTELYLSARGEALWKWPDSKEDEICLGIKSASLAPVREGDVLPRLDVRFVPTEE